MYTYIYILYQYDMHIHTLNSTYTDTFQYIDLLGYRKQTILENNFSYQHSPQISLNIPIKQTFFLILNIAGLEEQFLLKKVFYFHVPAVVY